MIIANRIEADIKKKKTRDNLIKSLQSETDAFVKGVAVETIQTVWKTSFGLRASAVDALNVKAIEKAAAKALQFLEQGQ